MIPFYVIAAVDQEFGIGKDGRMPWHLAGDLKHFRQLTTDSSRPGKENVVLMGRKTWDSLDEKYRPLPKRLNLVVTRQKDLTFPGGVLKADDFLSALDGLDNNREGVGTIFVIGGSQIFGQALRLPSCEKIYLTHIQKTFDCDTFFPKDLSRFREVSRSSPQDEGPCRYFFAEYKRISS